METITIRLRIDSGCIRYGYGDDSTSRSADWIEIEIPCESFDARPIDQTLIDAGFSDVERGEVEECIFNITRRKALMSIVE